MSRVYKTAKGKSVDMDKIKLANETTVAIGNMKVNARGDLLGAGGQITAGRNQIMDQAYAVSAASTDGYSPLKQKRANEQAAADATKAKALHDLANGLIEDTSGEPIVDETDGTKDTAPTTTSRGTLASSVAKTVTVTQGPITDPRKPKGPSRI